MLAVPGAATAKDERSGPDVLPTDGYTTESTSCLGAQSDILHPPGSPDVDWPFGPEIVAATNATVQIVKPSSTSTHSIARVTLVDASQNLPTSGETSGPDAFSFNLPFNLDKDNIRIISPSTFKRFRTDSTPGGGAPFGRFDYQVRRDEHDQTAFVFEIVVPWVHLKLSDFGVNSDGHQFVTRINGIFWDAENENRAFSDCRAVPPGNDLPPGDQAP